MERLSQLLCPEGPSLEAARLAPSRIQWGSPPQATFPVPRGPSIALACPSAALSGMASLKS
eukprot:4959864-Alexandrium_andersonii.AAC.1